MCHLTGVMWNRTGHCWNPKPGPRIQGLGEDRDGGETRFRFFGLYQVSPWPNPRSRRRGGTGGPVMRDRVKSVIKKWWLWKHRNPTSVSNPFCVCPRGTRRTLVRLVLMTPILLLTRTQWRPKTLRTKSDQRHGTIESQPFHNAKRLWPSTSWYKCWMIRHHRLLSGTNCTATPWGWVQTKTTYCTKPSVVCSKHIQPCGCSVTTTIVYKCLTSRISLTHRGMRIWSNTTCWVSHHVMTK